MTNTSIGREYDVEFPDAVDRIQICFPFAPEETGNNDYLVTFSGVDKYGEYLPADEFKAYRSKYFLDPFLYVSKQHQRTYVNELKVTPGLLRKVSLRLIPWSANAKSKAEIELGSPLITGMSMNCDRSWTYLKLESER